ncbi:MAG: hypothetical protein IH914_01655 [candidate division Zixibacteria bacterium]|nr:hypothetical protein [candidate division Zixibacteria bacterium]
MKRDKKSALKPLILAALTSLAIAGSAPALSAAPALRDGSFLRAGFGFSPLAKTSLDLSDFSITETGVAVTLAGGIIWDRRHSIEIRWQNVYLSGETNPTQGALAFTYTRYLSQRGPSPFFSGGIGLQHGPFIGVPGTPPGTSVGAAVFLGAGLRFTRRLSVGADYSFGSTDKFIDNTFKYDFSHQQLVFSAHYTLLGG